ncbi:hypothetical protein ACM66T_07545 [Sulfurimonas sp. ST-25]|uniref:hypothetical protein n=1 Tax=Sulfurimonas sp. ST-25 TaxID=3400151 RepID=UPI003A8AE639
MLDITGNEISELDDEDLSTLIGRLCEAELQKLNLSTAGITYGGHHNAPDGGIDIKIYIKELPNNDGYIPRPKSIIQVKKPDMPPAKIIAEMKPKGVIRDFFADLADSNGAYIIASSGASIPDPNLQERIKTMHGVLSDVPNGLNIKVDFYDRERIAAWVRMFPAMTIWVRQKIGRSLQGWRGYENWAKCPKGIDEEYLFDDALRLHHGSVKNDGEASLDGLNHLRRILEKPQSSVRLTGLSGVGKTRFVQALFDNRIGEGSLSSTSVVYTDLSDSPEPSPTTFVEQLRAMDKRIVVVIDNCGQELHKKLTNICNRPESQLSLLTVEYDVREDLPEETEVYQLEAASAELIKKVLLLRYETLGEINAHTIADFSGGNARIAIALAQTVERGESLSHLKDGELFERLFHQRNTPDDKLLATAEVCSLVYSFQSEAGDEPWELDILAGLVGLSSLELYRHIGELQRRGLVQQRSIWRAVLPHAIANRLAKRALQNIPITLIEKQFFQHPRLLKSFSKRLGFLHDSLEALAIARKWLSDNGILKDISSLNDLGMELFRNIAPVDLESTLHAFERAVDTMTDKSFISKNNYNYVVYTHILRSLAYNPEFFKRSISVLIIFILENASENSKEKFDEVLVSLFQPKLSGTHAKAEQRLEIIKDLFDSSEEFKTELAWELLKASLKSWHFVSGHGFDFGSRPRDFGYVPRSDEEIHDWYSTFFDYLVELLNQAKFTDRALNLLTNEFRALWRNCKLYDELESVTQRIHDDYALNELYIVVNSTIHFDGGMMDEDALERLKVLSELAKPTTLIRRARLYALTDRNGYLSLEETIEDTSSGSEKYHRINEETYELAKEVIADESVFNALLPELVMAKNYGRLYFFGQGLAAGTVKHMELWGKFINELSNIPDGECQIQMLEGFLNELQRIDIDVCNQLLDNAVYDETLCRYFPWLQNSIELDKKAVERFCDALEFEHASIMSYIGIAYGRSHESINDSDLCTLLYLMVSKKDGLLPAITILGMRVYSSSSEKKYLSDEIKKLACKLVPEFDFIRDDYVRHDNYDHEIARIIEACFVEEYAKEAAIKVCNNLLPILKDYWSYQTNYYATLTALAITKPQIFLDSFVSFDLEAGIEYQSDMRDRGTPLEEIDDEIIKAWCEIEPAKRFEQIAGTIRPYKKDSNSEELVWSPLALYIIRYAPIPINVLEKFGDIFYPNSWSGSLSSMMESRLTLITYLKSHELLEVSAWAEEKESYLRKSIEKEREWERERSRKDNERFE